MEGDHVAERYVAVRVGQVGDHDHAPAGAAEQLGGLRRGGHQRGVLLLLAVAVGDVPLAEAGSEPSSRSRASPAIVVGR